MLSPALLSLALAAVTAVPAGVGVVPYATTEASALSTSNLRHHEVLRIRRDFGKPTFEIVVDSWSPADAPDRISDVRMWWVQNDADGKRSPFGKKVHKFVELEYTARTEDAWVVTLRADRKQFEFDVELDSEGHAEAYADVITDDGRTVSHCRATEGQLVARRMLGIPIGIKRLEVRCVDARGAKHEGTVAYTKLRNGPVYSG